MNRSERQKGYTIVEMMIVVVIIGILISIAVPNYRGVLSKARKSACLANQRAIELARMYYSIDNDGYGVSIADIADTLGEMGFIGDSDQDDLICPIGGAYVFVTDSFEVTCSIIEHNN